MSIFDSLSAQAKASPRLCMAMDLRIVLKTCRNGYSILWSSGSVIPIHGHNETSEDFIRLRGEVKEILYDDQSNKERVLPTQAQRHSLVCMEENFVLFKSKNGAYAPLAEDEVMK